MPVYFGDLQIRAKIDFPGYPSGIYVTDRDDTGTSAAEVRVKDWGEAVLLMDGGEDSATLRLSNLPMTSSTLGADARFSSFWTDAQPPEGSKVTFEFRTSSASAWESYFVGAISEVPVVTERDVELQVQSRWSEFDEDVGAPITRTEYPQAAADAVDAIKPIIFHQIEKFVPPLVRARQKSNLKQTILASTVISGGAPLTVTVTTNLNWPTTGKLKINEEVFLYDQTGIVATTQFKLVARAQDGTSPATHVDSDGIEELAQAKWLVAGHKCQGITNIYGVSQSGKTVLLDPSLFTVDLGGVSGQCTVTLNSELPISISVPSETPTYRRIEMDTVDTPTHPASMPLGFVTKFSDAVNPSFAAGASAGFQQDNAAALKYDTPDVGNARLALKRANAFEFPSTPPQKVWLAVEHYGLSEFGEATKLKAPLTTLVFGGQSSMVLDSPFDLGASGVGAPASLTAVFFCEGELLNVLSLDIFTGIFQVGRGFGGTPIKDHPTGAVVRLYSQSNVGGAPVASGIYAPQVYAWLRQPTGTTVDPLGKLVDISDIPDEIIEKDKGYDDAGTLTAWHGHKVLTLPTGGYYISGQAEFNGAQYLAPGFLGQFMLGHLAPSGQFGTTIPQMAFSDDITYGVPIPAGGFIAVLDPNTAMGVSTQQRIAYMHFKLVYAEASGSGSTQIRFEVHLPDGSGNDFIVAQTTDSTSVSIVGAGSLTPPKTIYFKVYFDGSNGYPKGLKVNALLSKNFFLKILELSGSAKVYYVSCDFKFADAQLENPDYQTDDGEGGASGHSVVEIRPTLCLATSSSYSNAGTPGPLGSGAGNNYDSTRIVPELMTSYAFAFLTEFAGGFFIRNTDNAKNGIVRFNDNPGGSEPRDIVGARFYFTAINAPGKARVYRVTLCMRVGAKTSAERPTVYLERYSQTNGTVFAQILPSTESAGSPPYFGQSIWKWSWNLTQLDSFVTVRDFSKIYRILISAEGTGDNAFYANGCVANIEFEGGNQDTTSPENAAQFTRINYFDAGALVADYGDILDRTAEVHLASSGYEYLPGLTVVPQSEDHNKPIYISRVFWVFRFTGTESETLERIAVDVKGIELIPGLSNGFDSILNAATYGSPLLSLDPLLDFDAVSYTNAIGIPGTKALAIKGALQEKLKGRELMDLLCEQALMSAFFEAGRLTFSYKPDPLALGAPVAAFSYASGHILDDSLSIVRRPPSSVSNRVVVKAKPNYVEGGYEISVGKQIAASIAKYGERTLEFEADFIQTEAEAERLATRLVQYRAEPETVVRFQTTLFQQARTLQRSFIISVTHPLYTGTRLEVVGIAKAQGSLESGIPVYEIEAVARPLVVDPITDL